MANNIVNTDVSGRRNHKNNDRNVRVNSVVSAVSAINSKAVRAEVQTTAASAANTHPTERDRVIPSPRLVRLHELRRRIDGGDHRFGRRGSTR